MSYAIAFDLDTTMLKQLYPNNSWQNAYGDIKNTLETFGFDHQQGSVYFGNDTITAVKCVLAAQQLSQKYAWFKPSVSDIRMLRIEEMNDLEPAL
jgi:virulence-associated protein VapD